MFGPFPNTFATRRYSFTGDGQGNYLDDPGSGTSGTSGVLFLSGVPCRVQALRGAEQLAYGRQGVDAKIRLFCNPVDVDETDRLYLNVPGYPLQAFDVKFVEEVYGFAGVDHLEILLRENRNEQL